MISSNKKNSVFLRAKDPAMAQSWYNAIQAGAASLLPRVKEEMRSMQPGMEVKHLGWITEQVLGGGGKAMVKLICSLIESLKYFWSFDRNFNVRRYLRVQRNPYWLCWLTRTCSCIPRVLKAKRASTIRQRATRSSPPGFHPYSTRYITWHLCFRSLSYINAFT